MKRSWITLALTTLILTQAGAQPSNEAGAAGPKVSEAAMPPHHYAELVTLMLQDNDFFNQVLDGICPTMTKERLSGVIFSQIEKDQTSQLNSSQEKAMEQLRTQKKNALAGAKKSGASPKEIKKLQKQYEDAEKETTNSFKTVQSSIESTKKMGKPEMSVQEMATLALVTEKYQNIDVLHEFCINFMNMYLLCNHVFQPKISKYDSTNHEELIKKIETLKHDNLMKTDTNYNSLAKLVGGTSDKVVSECRLATATLCSPALPEAFRKDRWCKKYSSTEILKELQKR